VLYIVFTRNPVLYYLWSMIRVCVCVVSKQAATSLSLYWPEGFALYCFIDNYYCDTLT